MFAIRSRLDLSLGPLLVLVGAWAVLAAVVLASLADLPPAPPTRPVAERGPRPGDRW